MVGKIRLIVLALVYFTSSSQRDKPDILDMPFHHERTINDDTISVSKKQLDSLVRKLDEGISSLKTQTETIKYLVSKRINHKQPLPDITDLDTTAIPIINLYRNKIVSTDSIFLNLPTTKHKKTFLQRIFNWKQ